ncbi:hypothetical protein [Geomonas edaphica]|uniref:hypothetical protein n=1 Tax=Geomonas edaphica TaxID=2570226 RepID=UPI0010A88076|nr:hypothetical protein [Geomonas edaphica]
MEQVHNQIASGPLRMVRRGPAICAFLVLLLTFWNSIPYSEINLAVVLKLLAAKAIVFFCTYFLAVRLTDRMQQARTHGLDSETRTFLLFFAFFICWFGFWLIGLWPGYFMTDSYATLWTMYSLQFDGWFSRLHPLIYLALYQLLPNAVVVPIFQIILTSSVFAYAMAKLRGMGLSRLLQTLLVVLLVASVPTTALTLLATRDTIFSVVLLFLALWMFFDVSEKKREELSLKELSFVAAALLFISIYRGDGIALVLAVPLLLRMNKRVTTATAVALFVSVLLLSSPAKSFLRVLLQAPTGEETAYSVSLMMNPLGYLLQNNYVTATPEKDRKILGMLVQVDKVKEVSIPYEIPAFWEGHWRQGISDIAFSRVKSLYARMVRENLGMFLKNRWLCFAASTGMTQAGFTYSDMSREKKHPAHYDVVYNEPLHRALFPSLYELQSETIASTSVYKGKRLEGKFLHWNFLPELALSALVLLLFPWFPATASASLVVLSRVPLVFLAAPASQFKYYYSLYLFGFFVIFMLIAEKKVHSRVKEGAR